MDMNTFQKKITLFIVIKVKGLILIHHTTLNYMNNMSLEIVHLTSKQHSKINYIVYKSIFVRGI